jgi:hypothetical protein
MKDIILKPGTFLEEKKNSHTNKIPGQSLEDYIVSLLKNNTCCTKALVLSKGTVTQATSITTGVTLNAPAGKITTVALTTAANSVESAFTVTNSFVKADSVVVASIVGYSGATLTGDLPQVYVNSISAGSFNLIVGNGGSGTLDGTVTISFVIL